MTWCRCECGCGWEGEDEVTQWLVQEASFAALDAADARAESQAMDQAASESRLREMALRQIGGRG